MKKLRKFNEDRPEDIQWGIEPPFPMEDHEVDVRWPDGRCFEQTIELLPYIEESITESASDNVKITIPKKEYKLLITLLKDLSDLRSDMGCNDPDKKEEKLFTKQERIAMTELIVGKQDAEELDGFMYNNWYADYMIKSLKNNKS